MEGDDVGEFPFSRENTKLKYPLSLTIMPHGRLVFSWTRNSAITNANNSVRTIRLHPRFDLRFPSFVNLFAFSNALC